MCVLVFVCVCVWGPRVLKLTRLPACLTGSTPSRTAGFLGTSSPGPMADLYAAANQDSGVSSYISAASPAPSTGFGHGLGVGHTRTYLTACMDAHIIQRANRKCVLSCVLRVLWLLLRSLMATTETAQVTEDGRASPLLTSQSKCWLPTDGTNLIGRPQAPPGSPGSLWLHPPTEYLFKSWTLFCCTNLTSNITSPSSPFLSSCSLITRSPPSSIRYPLFLFWSWDKKTAKNKKKSLRKHLSSLTKTQRTILSFFLLLLLLFYFNVICRFIMKSFKAVTDVNRERKSRARWVFVRKPFLTKEEQTQQSPFFNSSITENTKKS